MSTSIRLATEEDAPGVLEIYGPVVRDTHISFELEPPTLDEMARRILTTCRRYPWLVCSDGDAIIGYSYASSYRSRPAYQWTVETTVYVSEKHVRKGVGQALYTSLLECLRIQGYYKALAVIALPNEPSIALHRVFGFTRIGHFDAVGYKNAGWRDSSLWQLQLIEPSPNPKAPLEVREVQCTLAWIDALHMGEGKLRLPAQD